MPLPRDPQATAAAVAGVEALRLTLHPYLTAGTDRIILGELEPLTCAAMYAVLQLLMVRIGVTRQAGGGKGRCPGC